MKIYTKINSTLRYIVFLAIIVCTMMLSQISFAQRWDWQNPIPTGDYLHSTNFATNQIGWAVGVAGGVFKTSDGGSSWQKQSSISYPTLWTVTSINSQIAWTAGSNGTILKTTDGGNVWNILSFGTNNNTYQSIKFIDSLTGWIVGNSGIIMKTTDGGISWNSQSSGTTNSLNCVYPSTKFIGWAVGDQGTILKTTNGGTTWQAQTSGVTVNLQSISTKDGQALYACGGGGTILISQDAGVSWQPRQSGVQNIVEEILFTTSQVGYCITDNGQILFTSNGGSIWNMQSSGTTDRLYSISSIDGQTAYIVGIRGTILKTTNSGITWLKINKGISTTFNVLSFIDKNNGWVTGDGGAVVKTSDGGNTWNRIGDIDTTRQVNIVALVFVTDKIGYASSGLGSYKTSNGGISWQYYSDNELNDKFYFVNKKIGYKLRMGIINFSTLAATSDSGSTWIDLQTISGRLNGLYFITDSLGWIVGDSGRIYKTSNAGNSWQKLSGGTTRRLTSVYFSTIQNGWAVGDSGIIIRTTNGGSSWSSQSSNTIFNFNKVTFSDSTTGWIIGTLENYGNAGEILVTTDGGNSWHNNRQFITFNKLKDIVFVDNESGWIVGENGTILKYSAPPILVTPANNATNVNPQTTFVWKKKTKVNTWFLAFYSDTVNLSDWKEYYITDTIYSVSSAEKLKPNTKYICYLHENNRYGDFTGATFTTGNLTDLKITYPNGGEILAAGDSVDITWIGATAQDTVILELNTGGSSWDSVNYFAKGTQYKWKVPKIENSWCIISAATSMDYDESDTTFTISIPKGTASDIDFGTTTVGTPVQKISYCISTGIALLRVQDVLFKTGTQFILKNITRNKDSSIISIEFSTQTSGTFTDTMYIITQAGDSILATLKGEAKDALKPIIVYPNGGEILSAGDTITIRWKGVAFQDSVTLAKTTNGGNTWTFFTTKTADSVYRWKLPKVESSQCKIRILTKSDSDDSDNDFTISIPVGTASTIDFGDLELQKVDSKDITITNTGKVPLKISMIRNTQGNPFSTADTAVQTIQTGKNLLVQMTFIPTSVGIIKDTMQWITTAGDTITALMSGRGFAPKPGVNANFVNTLISICQFTDTLITVKISGGTPPFMYNWSYSNGSTIPANEIKQGGTSSDSTIRLLPISTNNYRVIVNDSQGQSDTATIIITVKKHPTPTLFVRGNTTFCEGDSTLIEVVNEVNYTGAPLWSDGTIGASLWVKQSGKFYCTIDSNGCVGVSDSISIIVNPKPSVSISQQGNELISTTADSYQWLNSSGNNIAGATSQRYSPPSDDKYSVLITINGCSAVSSQFQFIKNINPSTIIVLQLNFGQQVVSNIIGRNAPLRNSIRVLNNGNTDRTIDSIQITGQVFSLKSASFPRPIPAAVTINFNVDFTPTSIGKFVETVTVFSGGERFTGLIMGEGIDLPIDGVITEVELVPEKFEVSPGDTLLVFLRIKDEQPTESKATEFISAMQYDSRVLQWIPRNRQFNDDNSKRTNYWSLNMQNKKRFKGNNQLDTLKFLVKLSDVDSTALIFTDSTAFIWTDANGKVFPACRDSVVYIRVCAEGGKQFIRFANPDNIKTITPNPSAGNSTITMSMGIEGECSISLIDIFGQTIQESRFAKLPVGDHQIQFDDSTIETGTYYVVMRTGFSVSSKKISIVK